MSVFNRSSLEEALKKLKTVLPNRSVIPVYEYILIEPEEGGNTVTATNGETWVRCKVESEPVGTSVLVPGGTFVKTIGSLKTENVDIVVNSSFDVQIKSGKHGKYSLSGIDGNDAARVDRGDYRHIATLDAVKVRPPLGMILSCVASDMIKVQLAQVCLKPGLITSTNEYIMAAYQTDDEITEQIALVPSALEAILLSDGPEIEIYTDGNTAHLTCGDVSVYSILIDPVTYPYPDLQRFIDHYNGVDHVGVLYFDRKDALAVSRRISTFQDKDAPVFMIDFENEAPLISSRNMSRGSKGVDEFLCEYDGDKIKIAVNPDHFMKLLQDLPGDQITLKVEKLEGGCYWESGELCGVLMLRAPI